MRGETDWEAAEREAWEEAGVDITTLNYLGKRRLKFGKYFILKMESSSITLKPQEENTLLVCWLSKSALRQQMDQNNADLNTLCAT